jgi:hypothetical protein
MATRCALQLSCGSSSQVLLGRRVALLLLALATTPKPSARIAGCTTVVLPTRYNMAGSCHDGFYLRSMQRRGVLCASEGGTGERARVSLCVCGGGPVRRVGGCGRGGGSVRKGVWGGGEGGGCARVGGWGGGGSVVASAMSAHHGCCRR